MSDKRLYIIGNGFDIFHGIKSKYSDFKDFVKKQNRNLFDALEEYFNSDELWADFEETLAYIDMDKIVDDASDFLISYAAEDWSDAYHHDYQYEIRRVINIVTVDLKKIFTRWVLELDIPTSKKLPLPKSSTYLTFNYTKTLEKNYQIPSANIVYIHNKAVDENSTLILGHSRQPTQKISFNEEIDMEDEDVRIAEGHQILNNYFLRTYKNTETIISEKQSFFNQIKNIDEIYVFGHSISTVDQKYFEKILSVVSKNATWTVSYYGHEQQSERFETLLNLGIEADKIKLIQLTDL